ncbi:hypothetical protein Goarm_000672, partial [Gossypium armourianum]|nr:hypothetical protein [Gossypium armourianum]
MVDALFLWRALAKVWPLIRENLLWSVGDGRNIKYWCDPWVPNIDPLVNWILEHSCLDLDCLLSDMVTNGGGWNLDLFRLWLPEELIKRIVGIPPSHATAGTDKPKETMWHLPWKYQVPQRVPFFLCLAFKQQLLTNTERVHRGLRHNSVCGHISEDVIHAIRDCPAARSIWNQLIPVEEHDRRHVTEVCGATPCSILSESGVCLNTEGSVRHDDGFAVVGGFVRDHDRKWLFEFNRYLGSCSVFDAELWGILDGLTCLVDRGYDNIVIQSNNLDVVKNIQE